MIAASIIVGEGNLALFAVQAAFVVAAVWAVCWFGLKLVSRIPPDVEEGDAIRAAILRWRPLATLLVVGMMVLWLVTAFQAYSPRVSLRTPVRAQDQSSAQRVRSAAPVRESDAARVEGLRELDAATDRRTLPTNRE